MTVYIVCAEVIVMKKEEDEDTVEDKTSGKSVGVMPALMKGEMRPCRLLVCAVECNLFVEFN